jgi:hypothetical protein
VTRRDELQATVEAVVLRDATAPGKPILRSICTVEELVVDAGV